ncbi:polysaccharide biosynthesis/export family protein [Hallella multisaccharivorax]|uniref:Polysaccharide export protein n=1 Tax=Hallella multisaccharivorax DSM 17128 TaxID=688246 RepID=F8N9T1_9BACT|nr:polysaccharide biosynthesis/export family protein [Hallella multisaccharivorax]EGN56723.1 polysaccharide export protein [Hallella multisaccharivorax DSM 17128]
MKKILFFPFVCAILLLIGSCTSMRHFTYFQNIDSVDLSPSKGLPETKVMPNDELTIIVKTTNPDASEPFNLFGTKSGYNNGYENVRGYLVDNEGAINFPVLGRIHVGGLTRPEVEDTITKKLKPYLAQNEKPVVICRLKSFRVTMIGELGSKVIDVPNEKINIIEALAQAGDMSMYGKRTNVLLVREDSTGEKHTHRYNMNDANIFNDPYYYLKQNDIVYVQPTKQKTVQASTGSWTTLWVTVLGWVTSVASLVLTILK